MRIYRRATAAAWPDPMAMYSCVIDKVLLRNSTCILGLYWKLPHHTSECLVSCSLECHESVLIAVCDFIMKATFSAVLESQTRQVNKDQRFLVAKI